MAEIRDLALEELKRRGVDLSVAADAKRHNSTMQMLDRIAAAIESAAKQSASIAEKQIAATKILTDTIKRSNEAGARIAEEIKKAKSDSDAFEPIAKAMIAQSEALSGKLAEIAEALTVIAAEEKEPERKRSVKFKYNADGDIVGAEVG